MAIKSITEGMTAEQVSGLLDDNFAEVQKGVNEAKGAVGTEELRAKAAEEANAEAIGAEVERAEAAEAAEAERAQAAERALDGRITEVQQGSNAAIEALAQYAGEIDGNVAAETERAQAAELENRQKIEAEVTRAKGAEEANAEAIGDEVARAKEAEASLTEDIGVISGDLENEIQRAQAAEQALSTEITEAENRVDERVTEVRDNLEAEVQARSVDISDLNANTGISEYPAFDPAADYAVGDVVNYEGRLKRFTEEHAAGEWIGTDVESWSERKEKIDDALITNRSINLFNPLAIVEHQGISNDGILFKGALYSDWATSNYIRVKPDTDYHLSVQGNKSRTITYLLCNKNFETVEYAHTESFSSLIHTTADSAFLIFNVRAYGQGNTKMMLVEGDEKINYIPYNTIPLDSVEGLQEELDILNKEKQSKEEAEIFSQSVNEQLNGIYTRIDPQLSPVVDFDFSDPSMWDAGYYLARGLKYANKSALTYAKPIGLVRGQKIKMVWDNTVGASPRTLLFDAYDKWVGQNVSHPVSVDSLLAAVPNAAYIRFTVVFNSVEEAIPEELIGGLFSIESFKGIEMLGTANDNIKKLDKKITDNKKVLNEVAPILSIEDNWAETETILSTQTIDGFYNFDGVTINSSGDTNYKGHTAMVADYRRVSIEKYEVFISGTFNYAVFDSDYNIIAQEVTTDTGYKSLPIEIELPYDAYYIRFNSRNTQNPVVKGYRRDLYISGEKIKDGSITKSKLAFNVPETKSIELTIANSDKIGIIGDSYTESAYAVKGKSYISKLSLFSDYQFVNFGESGDIYAGRIADIRNKIPRYGTIPYDEQKTKYTMMCCFTNDIKYMSNSQYFQSLENAIKAVMGIGSIPIVCTEYHTNFSAKNKSQIRTGIIDIAKKYRLECWDISQIVDLLYTTRYEPFWGGSHMGTRTNAMEADNYEKFLNNLEAPMQSIKIFNAKNISDDYDDYMFTSNEERAKLFKEINVGAADLKNASNVDAIPGSSIQVTNSEYQSLISGTALTINKVSLVSAVLPAFAKDIQKLSLSLDCSAAKVLIKDSMASPYPTVEKLSSFYIDFTDEPAVGDVYLCAEDNKEYTVVSHVVDEAGDYHLLCTPFVSSGFATTGTLTKVSGNGDATLSYSFREMGINPSNITEDTVGHWVELTGDGNGNYDISNLVGRCVDVDKCHFLIVSESDNLTLNDVRIKAEIAKEKNIYRPKPYKFESTYNSDAEELLPASTFGTAGTLDSNWNVTPVKIYEDIQGVKSYPKECSSVVKVTDNVNLSCTVDGSKLKNGTARLEIWCRYFPDIYTDGSGNQITENSYDYNDIIVKVEGQETTLTQRVNTYWKIVEFDVYTVKGSNLYLKIHSNNEGIEVARVSMKYI